MGIAPSPEHKPCVAQTTCCCSLREELTAKVVKIADAYTQAARGAAGSQVVDVIGASIGDGDVVRRVHVLDLNVLSANGARAIATLLANVTVPKEETHRLGE